MMVFIGMGAFTRTRCRSCPELCQELRGFLFVARPFRPEGAGIASPNPFACLPGLVVVSKTPRLSRRPADSAPMSWKGQTPAPLASLACGLCCALRFATGLALRAGAGRATFATRGGPGFHQAGFHPETWVLSAGRGNGKRCTAARPRDRAAVRCDRCCLHGGNTSPHTPGVTRGVCYASTTWQP